MTSIKEKRISKKEYRKNQTDLIAEKYINDKNLLVDEYAENFIKEVFNYAIAGKKAYRMYAAHDVNSSKRNEAVLDMKFGTWHHMYLFDKNIKYGLPNKEWSNTELCNGITKETMIYTICHECIINESYLEVTKLCGIKRDLKWEGYE